MAAVAGHGEPPTSTARRQDPAVGLDRQPIRASGTFREVRDLYPVSAERCIERSVLHVSRNEECSQLVRAPGDDDLAVGLDHHVVEILASLHEARDRLASISEGTIGIPETVVASEGEPPLVRRPRRQDLCIGLDGHGREVFAGFGTRKISDHRAIRAERAIGTSIGVVADNEREEVVVISHHIADRDDLPDVRVITRFETGSEHDSFVSELAVQPDGKLVAAGTAAFASNGLARYEVDGSLDASFGVNGKVITDAQDVCVRLF